MGEAQEEAWSHDQEHREESLMPALVEEKIKRVWHEGRQKLVYVLKQIKHMSPL